MLSNLLSARSLLSYSKGAILALLTKVQCIICRDARLLSSLYVLTTKPGDPRQCIMDGIPALPAGPQALM